MAMGSSGISAAIPRVAAFAGILTLSSVPAVTQTASIEELVSAVVRVNTHITPDGRTVQGLGREREGSGILIDGDGLILTIGYLMVEAYAAEVIDNNGHALPAAVVGYDHETGFGLLRTIEPLKLKPMALGKSAEMRAMRVRMVMVPRCDCAQLYPRVCDVFQPVVPWPSGLASA